MNWVDELPLVGRARRRMRLEPAERHVVRGPPGKGAVYRYKDPETGVIYRGKSRWGFLNPRENTGEREW